MIIINNIVIIGNLVKDSELKYTTNGKAMLNFTVAVQRIGKDNGSDFIPVIAWGTYGEKLSEFLVKGSKVAIKGRLKIDNIKDDKGNYKTYVNINAEEVKTLGNKKGNKDKTDFNETYEDMGDSPW